MTVSVPPAVERMKMSSPEPTISTSSLSTPPMRPPTTNAASPLSLTAVKPAPMGTATQFGVARAGRRIGIGAVHKPGCSVAVRRRRP